MKTENKDFKMELQLFADTGEENNESEKKDTEILVDENKANPPVDGNKDTEKSDQAEILKNLMTKIAGLEEKLEEKSEDNKPEREVETPADKDEDKKDDKEKQETSDLTAIKNELDQVKNDVKAKGDLVTEYEGILNSLIDAKMADVPEDLKALVPDNLPIKDKLNWIIKAEKTGIFGGKGSIEIGKPLNPKDTKTPADDSKLSASAKMALAYGNSKKKK